LTDRGGCLTYSKLAGLPGAQRRALTPLELTAVFWLAIGAIIGTMAAPMDPETQEVDFH
jgi:hypothetical protein